ncbi:carboxymuconolactone decarboxylase family protein [Paucidesulfovibrio longus]|uniref:carboxymuconolactone decarboxylase family protein n=1 Tax=Paucidesulfovibrio longus TaxID=889 RepID=UPI0003B54D83|nr:carboxymuconolactone decarboxylase family protein [Paucidesulfovibrio longus]
MHSKRYEKGLEQLIALDGEAGEAVVQRLEKLFPDMGRLMVEFGFGDVFSRPGLDMRSREIATLGGLIALGHAQPQLAVHTHAALNVGVTQEEILEIVLHMAVYTGFPAALNALFTVSSVFAERDGKAAYAAS